VVAGHADHGDARIVKPTKLFVPKQASAIVRPVTVENIASQHDKRYLVIKGGLDQVFGGSTGGPTDLVYGSSLVGGKSAEGAVDM
jgi:hypothetical protein